MTLYEKIGSLHVVSLPRSIAVGLKYPHFSTLIGRWVENQRGQCLDQGMA